MMKSAFVVFAAVLLAGEATFIVPGETQVQSGLKVSPDHLHETGEHSTYGVQQRKLFDPHAALYPPTGRSYGYARPNKFVSGPHHGHDPVDHISSLEHDIKHQLAALGDNIAAARPYLAHNPALLHEAEEQLLALQHIHAGKLLHGIDSIRKLELQQETLIHQVNAQLENSVNQLKHLAILQDEISKKQKDVPQTILPPSTLEASKKLTSQLHAIEMAKTESELDIDGIPVGSDHSYGETSHHRVSSDAGQPTNDRPIIMPSALTLQAKSNSDVTQVAQVSEIVK